MKKNVGKEKEDELREKEERTLSKGLGGENGMRITGEEVVRLNGRRVGENLSEKRCWKRQVG